jgi:hypothetical protein
MKKTKLGAQALVLRARIRSESRRLPGNPTAGGSGSSMPPHLTRGLNGAAESGNQLGLAWQVSASIRS